MCSESRKLTTFHTPFEGYVANRLTFSISSAPEIFSRAMRVLVGIPGMCHMDDILVHSKDQESHDTALNAVLTRLQMSGLTFNKKCVRSTSLY